jgi:hypothetical protein
MTKKVVGWVFKVSVQLRKRKEETQFQTERKWAIDSITQDKFSVEKLQKPRFGSHLGL